jgi:hypothetical protein
MVFGSVTRADSSGWRWRKAVKALGEGHVFPGQRSNNLVWGSVCASVALGIFGFFVLVLGPWCL